MNKPDFSRKIRLRQSKRTIVLQLHAKFRKDPMTGFEKNSGQTNGRTDGRTNRGQSIGPTSYRRWVQKEYSHQNSGLDRKFHWTRKMKYVNGWAEERMLTEMHSRIFWASSKEVIDPKGKINEFFKFVKYQGEMKNRVSYRPQWYILTEMYIEN